MLRPFLNAAVAVLSLAGACRPVPSGWSPTKNGGSPGDLTDAQLRLEDVPNDTRTACIGCHGLSNIESS